MKEWSLYVLICSSVSFPRASRRMQIRDSTRIRASVMLPVGYGKPSDYDSPMGEPFGSPSLHPSAGSLSLHPSGSYRHPCERNKRRLETRIRRCSTPCRAELTSTWQNPITVRKRGWAGQKVLRWLSIEAFRCSCWDTVGVHHDSCPDPDTVPDG